jgi:hypothetical protein
MLENTWKTQGTIVDGSAFKNRLIWAHGDTTGFGFHADFTNGECSCLASSSRSLPCHLDLRLGWNTEVLTKALNDPRCLLNKSM